MAKENIVMNKSLLIITILLSISYNVYSQTFCSDLYPNRKDNEEYVVSVYNKTDNTLRLYVDYHTYLISDYKTDINIGCIEFIIKNNKAIYNKQFTYSISGSNISGFDITIKYIDNKEMENYLDNEGSFVSTDKAKYLPLIDLLIIADSVSINNKGIEIIYKNYKRTIKPLLEEKNKASIPLWYFFLKEKLAEIN